MVEDWKEFNAKSGVYNHDWKTLKSKYDNLKKTSKLKWADDKKYVLGTGEGPSQNTPSLNEAAVKLKSFMGDVQVLY